METKQGLANNYAINNSKDIECEDMVNAFIVGYESALRWIPVHEKLPNETGTYLVYNTCGGMMVWGFSNGWKVYGANQTITHWMPLPQHPECLK